MTRRYLSILCGILFLFPMVLFAGNPAGVWKAYNARGQERSIVRISNSGGTLSARVVQVLPSAGKPDAVCANCSGANKDKPIRGMTIMWGLKQTGENTWTGGKILRVETGDVYDCNATLSSDGRTLEVDVNTGFGTRTATWQRL